MNEDVYMYLWDVRESCDHIAQFMGKVSRSAYRQDILLQAAIERKLCIIGEALNRARKAEPMITELISNISQIIGLRNRLIHDYPDIDLDTLWGLLKTHLPVLRGEVDKILREG